MALKDWNILLSHISDVSDWLPFIVWISLPTETRNQFNKLGAYLFIIGLLKTTTLILLVINGKLNTMPFYHIMALAEVTFLFLFIARGINLDEKLLFIFLISLVLINFINSFFFQGIYEFNSNAWATNTIILISFSLFLLFKLFKTLEDIELEKSPIFIIITALLLYFSGSLFLYIVSSEVLSKEAKGFFYNAWIIRSSADILKSLILTYGLWLARFS